MEKASTYLRVVRLYRGFYSVCQASCPLRSDLLCVWIMYNLICGCSLVSCGACTNPRHCSSILQRSKPTILPLTNHSHNISVKLFLQGVDSVNPQNETDALHTLSGVISFLVLSFLDLGYFLVATGSRGPVCFLSIIFALGVALRLVARAETGWNRSNCDQCLDLS